VVVVLNPLGQYADDGNLGARQRFWLHQSPYFDIESWVLDLAGLASGMKILDAGCGNDLYLRAMARRQGAAPSPRGECSHLGSIGRGLTKPGK
jgi:2-polyprenyl-3-methyl-5-hydroxy-6-metoxy-1,4-benzoquinol methylase